MKIIKLAKTDWYKIAQTDMNSVSPKQTTPNPLDGRSNASARNAVHKLVYPHTKGLFSDQDWSNVNKVWDAMNTVGLDWNLVDTEYGKNNEGTLSYKVWRFEINFTNKTGRPTTLHGVLTAHGAGTVQDPLSKYDITVSVF